MKIIFSIVIPIYNSEKTLLNCIRSVKRQKFDPLIELILIDDASTDQSKKICRLLKKQNQNIQIIYNKKNLGVSISRNKGIKKAKGDYIIFLDSDDYFCNNVFDKIYSIVKNNDYDVLYFNSNLKKKAIYSNSSSAIKKINDQKNFATHCWNFIIKRSFLLNSNIFFNNIRIFEDQVFVSEILLKGKKFFFAKKKILIHNELSSSLSRMTDYTSAISCINVIEKIFLKFKKIKLNKNQKIFLNGRINFMANMLKIYFLSLNINKVKKILFLINKINNTYKMDSKLDFFKIKKINLFEELIKKNRKYIVTQLTKIILKDQKKIKKYIFSCGIFGRSLALICKMNKIKIHGFLDNNSKMIGQKFLNYKIFNPNILSKFSKKDLSKFILLIGHNDKKIKKNISNQILKYNIKKNNIIKINFFKELYNV